MTLKYKVMDLIEASKTDEINVIAHGCNCFNTMKSGIAPLIAKAYPGAEQADQSTEKGLRIKLGAYTDYECLTYRTRVFNLYSQYDYRGRRKGIMDLSYTALRQSLEKMIASLRARERILDISRSDWKIGLPKIGAGLAGGDWKIISGIIEDVTKGFDVTIYVLNEKEIPCK